MRPTMRLECPVARAARLHGERLALVAEAGDKNLRLSWNQLEHRVSRTAALLRAQDVSAGDRVSWCGANHPGALYLAAALPRLDATFVPLNARLTPAELEPLRRRTGARLSFDRAALEALDRSTSRSISEDPPSASFDPDRTHFVLFTSGTTGLPKGACLSLRSFVAGAEASAARLGSSPNDRWLCTLPLFHVGGLAMLYRAAHSGGALILHDRFDPERVRSALREESVTHLSLVDTTLRRLLESPGPERFGPSLHAVLVGGGPVSERRFAEGRARGLPLLQTYGLTETASQLCTQAVDEPWTGDAGLPLLGAAVRAVDESGLSVATDRVGHLEARSPALFQGYLNDPAATRTALTGDGWFRTGDLGAVDPNGRVRLLSRRSDLIVRGGENVYPAEVEQVLLACPGVSEATVLPRADDLWGQVPVAYVSLSDPAVRPQMLQSFCEERLARFKRPTRIFVLPALPRNALGKVDRIALSEQNEGQP